jgi:hypothetical protein
MSEIRILGSNTLSHKINTFFYSFENLFVSEVLIAMMSNQGKKENRNWLKQKEMVGILTRNYRVNKNGKQVYFVNFVMHCISKRKKSKKLRSKVVNNKIILDNLRRCGRYVFPWNILSY